MRKKEILNYNSFITEIERFDKFLLKKYDILNDVDLDAIPPPTVRRVARDLRNELLEKIKILQSEALELQSQGKEIEQNQTINSKEINKEAQKESFEANNVEITKDEFSEYIITFEKIKPSLLENPLYKNKFVAIVKNEVVDSDQDEEKLAKRIYDKLGYIPMYIGYVSEKTRPAKIPSVFGSRK